MDKFTISFITIVSFLGWVFLSEDVETGTYLLGWLVIGFGVFWSISLWKNDN